MVNQWLQEVLFKSSMETGLWAPITAISLATFIPMAAGEHFNEDVKHVDAKMSTVAFQGIQE